MLLQTGLATTRTSALARRESPLFDHITEAVFRLGPPSLKSTQKLLSRPLPPHRNPTAQGKYAGAHQQESVGLRCDDRSYRSEQIIHYRAIQRVDGEAGG